MVRNLQTAAIRWKRLPGKIACRMTVGHAALRVRDEFVEVSQIPKGRKCSRAVFPPSEVGPLAVAFLLLIAASGVRRFFHQLRHRQTPKQLQAARESFRNRLVHPSPSEVEQGIGGFLPQRLIALYADPSDGSD